VVDSYREPGHIEREVKMDERDFTLLILKRVTVGIIASILLISGADYFITRVAARSAVEAEHEKAEGLKAERDRAMYESLGRLKP
jgi:hypothetical protein